MISHIDCWLEREVWIDSMMPENFPEQRLAVRTEQDRQDVLRQTLKLRQHWHRRKHLKGQCGCSKPTRTL